MTTQLRCEHDLRCHRDAFWAGFLDDALNQRLFCGALEFPAYAIVERSEEGQTLRRRIAITPKLELPPSIAKLIGEHFRYEEVGELDRAIGLYSFRLQAPHGMGNDKASIAGTLRAEPLPNGETRRVVDMMIDVRMFGLGSMLERFAAQAIQDRYAAHARAWNAVLARTV